MKDILTLAESKALRGIAIMGIVLHNYCHFHGFAVKENEYTFDAGRPMAFFERLQEFDKDLFIHFFSFFGHYGVPVFLFVSGFGLVMKYETHSTGSVKPLSFIGKHYIKLLRLMIIGYLVFMGVYFIRHDSAAEVFTFERIVEHITMTVNFLEPRPDRIILPGPYWYFGLMLQLYVLYALVLNRWRCVYLILSLVAACWLAQVLCQSSFDALNLLRYNFIGAMLPFATGIVYARYGKLLSKYAYLTIAVVSAVAVFAGSMCFHSWLWVPLFVVTGAVATVRILPAWIIRPCAWMGGVSAALFVTHPIVREVVITHYRQVDIYFGIAIFVLASVSLAMILGKVNWRKEANGH